MYAENLANISRETGLELTTYSNELAVIDLPYGAIRMRTFPWMLWVTGSALSAATAGAGLQGFMQPTINGIGTLSNIDDENVPWTSIDANAYPGQYNNLGPLVYDVPFAVERSAATSALDTLADAEARAARCRAVCLAG